MITFVVFAAAAVLGFLFMPECSNAADRVAAARKDKEAKVKKMVADAGLSYPPHQVLIRVFKAEKTLEVWGRDKSDKSFTQITTYPVCASSGELGPKRKEGDYQVPEGVYRVDIFNPQSSFHLSLGINYPNQSDRVLSDKNRPGGEIFIHGNCVTIGCVPIKDDPIEELYILTIDSKLTSGNKPAVHIFPCRFDSKECKKSLASEAKDNPQLKSFWDNLEPVYTAFEKNKQMPKVTVDSKGKYKVQ
jgi:murein L,D-transpeptidase YafK